MLLKSPAKSTSPSEYLFQEVKEWRSELEFYKLEITFLQSLLEKYITGIIKSKDISSLSKLSETLKRKKNSILPTLTKKVLSYETSLSRIIKGFPVKSKSKFLKDHKEVKLKVFVFINEMRILKRKIFKIVEKIIAAGKKINAEYIEGSLTL